MHPDSANEPLISFIVTAYNLPIALLKECLDSILAIKLTDEEREIILVDDGSDPSPYASLEGYYDDIIYLRQENKGLSAARNAGLEKARGKYIQFVDGDDCLIKRGYDIIASKLRKPDTYFDMDIVMFKAARIPSPKSNFATLIKLFWYNSNKEYLTRKNLRAAAWGYVFRRARLGSLRFTPGIYHEDEEFTPRLILQTEYVIFTSIKAYYYRQRENSITLNPAKEHIEQRLRDVCGVILRLRHSALKESDLLFRRVHQLTMDYMYNAIKAADSYEEFCHYIQPLYENSLLPLPLRRYTAKYLLFALLTRFDRGRKRLYKQLH